MFSECILYLVKEGSRNACAQAKKRIKKRDQYSAHMSSCKQQRMSRTE